MGAYGTPEHLPPQKPIGEAEYYEPFRQAGEDMKWVCRACKMQFRGNYCPYCGTKAGKNKNWWFIKKTIIFFFGMIVGCLFFLLGIFIGKVILHL